jgi:hypothetical protein
VPKIIKNETPEIKAMFEYYYSLGDKRSYNTVADKYGVSLTTVKRYSASFKWVDRCRERDKSVNERIETLAVEGVVNSMTELRIQLKGFTDKAKEAFMSGKLKIKSIQDYERIVKLELEFMRLELELKADEDDGDIDNIGSLSESLAQISDEDIAKLEAQFGNGGDIPNDEI